jgi:hypothetical protein
MKCTPYKLSSITTSCGSNIPSIKQMWIGNFGSVTPTYTYVTGVTDADGNQIIESVSALALDNTTPEYWVEYAFRKNTCSASSEMTINDNGSHYFTNALNMIFAKQDTNKRLNIEAIASGDCACIYLDGNGKYWIMNLDAEVTLTSASANTGTAVGDSNQYDLVLSQDAATMPIEIVCDETHTPKSIVEGLMES